jgi:hypothetical protein
MENQKFDIGFVPKKRFDWGSVPKPMRNQMFDCGWKPWSSSKSWRREMFLNHRFEEVLPRNNFGAHRCFESLINQPGKKLNPSFSQTTPHP